MTRDDIVRKSKAEGGMFIVIPSVVKLDTHLPLSAQMLYGVITWKCNNYAYTWATNRELGEALGVSAKRVSALLSLLEEQGHIEMEIEYKDDTKEVLRRYIYPIMKSARSVKQENPPPENEDTPPPEREYPSPGLGIPPPENEEVNCNNKESINTYSPYSPPRGGAPAEVPELGTSFGFAERPSRQAAAAPVDKPQPAPKPRTRRSRAKKSVPTHAPERFERFWAFHPGGGSRLKAVAAWDALAPSDELIDEMARALEQQKKSRQWQEGVGIPHASTWLNQQRWTDKLPEAVKNSASGKEGADEDDWFE